MSEAHVNEALLRLIEDLLADPERLQRVGRLIFRKSEVQEWEPELGPPDRVAIDAALVLSDLTRVIMGDLPLASDPPPRERQPSPYPPCPACGGELSDQWAGGYCLNAHCPGRGDQTLELDW